MEMCIQQWNRVVQNAVQNEIGDLLDGEFLTVSYPAGLPCCVRQQYYNSEFLSTIDTRIVTEEGVAFLKKGFSSLYRKVIECVKYDFSRADYRLMEKELAVQNSMVSEIIRMYEQSGLDNEPDEYASVFYILKRILEVTGSNYMDVDIEKYPKLAGLCLKLREYSEKIKNTEDLLNAWKNAESRKKSIIEHISGPNRENGGIYVGKDGVCVGWEKLPDTEELLNGLNSGREITISIFIDNFNKNYSSIHYTENMVEDAPFCHILKIKKGQDQEYDLSNLAGSNSTINVFVFFHGVTVIEISPENLSLDGKKGWFDKHILCETARNSEKDSTGYLLNGSEFNCSELFGQNGKLCRLKTFVISQKPEIVLDFKEFSRNKLQTIFTEDGNVSFEFMEGTIKENDYLGQPVSSFNYGDEAEHFTVSLSPAPALCRNADSCVTAHILGGIAEYYE